MSQLMQAQADARTKMQAASCPEHLLAAGFDPTILIQIFQIVKDHVADIAAAWTLVEQVYRLFFPVAPK